MTMEPATGAPDEPRAAVPAAGEDVPRASPPGPMRCAADPSVETYLRCGRCEKPICPRCLIQTPVGARCRECARLRRLPMYEIGPFDYLCGIGAGLAAGIAGGVAVTLLLSLVPAVGFLGAFVMAGLGYVVGGAILLALPRKRGTGLGVVAALSVVIGLVVARAALFMLSGADVPTALAVAAATLATSIWSLLGLVVGMVVAFYRVR
jgi:hypothetical protein